MERSLLNITWRERKTNREIRNKTNVKDVVRVVKELKYRCAGHVVRYKDDRWTGVISDWYTRGSRRNKGRQSRRWEDDVRHWAGKCWRTAARNRNVWRRLGEALARGWDAVG